MTLDLEQFATDILAGDTAEEVDATIAAAQAQYDADMRAAVEEERRQCAIRSDRAVADMNWGLHPDFDWLEFGNVVDDAIRGSKP